MRSTGWWRHADDAVNATLLVLITADLTLQVFSRYVLNYSIGWTTELANALFGWMIFLGAPAMLRRHSHFNIWLFHALPQRLQRHPLMLVEAACLIFYVVLLVGSLDLVDAGRYFETPALEIGGAWLYAAIPVASVLLILRTLIRMLELRRGILPPWATETI